MSEVRPRPGEQADDDDLWSSVLRRRRAVDRGRAGLTIGSSRHRRWPRKDGGLPPRSKQTGPRVWKRINYPSLHDCSDREPFYIFNLFLLNILIIIAYLFRSGVADAIK